MDERQRLLLATHNAHKTQEIRDLMASEGLPYEVVSLHDLGDDREIEETGETLQDNSLLKAREGYRRHGISTFADDTGLEVAALGGRPGVYTARYAGPACVPADNIRKLLQEMTGVTDRRAVFKTVISLILDGREYLFTGEAEGEITTEVHGEGGFGYDPVFLPLGSDRTFAEMSEEEKNKISHRGRATAALIAFLKQHRG